MFATRRLASRIAVAAIMVFSSACGGTASIEAAIPVPTRIEAEPAPAASVNAAAAAVDAVVADQVAADSASTVGRPRSRGQRLAPERAAVTSIREIDFHNDFTFESTDVGPDQITVIDGEFQNGDFGDSDYFWFGVTGVEFGDLDGDGEDDAVVSTSWNGGGTGYFDSVTAFRLVDGQARQAGRVLFGDRADGGIHGMGIEDGNLSVWSFSTTIGACCPNQITRNTLVLEERSLARVAQGATRTWMSIDGYADISELKFLPGTNSAVVAVYGWSTEGAFTFEAVQGQVLTFALTNGPAPTDISMTDLTTGETLSGLAEMELPSTGFYEVQVHFDAERQHTTTIDVIIDGG